jgi:hypothetical protein
MSRFRYADSWCVACSFDAPGLSIGSSGAERSNDGVKYFTVVDSFPSFNFWKGLASL